MLPSLKGVRQEGTHAAKNQGPGVLSTFRHLRPPFAQINFAVSNIFRSGVDACLGHKASASALSFRKSGRTGTVGAWTHVAAAIEFTAVEHSSQDGIITWLLGLCGSMMWGVTG